jgi:hypothetical protein
MINSRQTAHRSLKNERLFGTVEDQITSLLLCSAKTLRFVRFCLLEPDAIPDDYRYVR